MLMVFNVELADKAVAFAGPPTKSNKRSPSQVLNNYMEGSWSATIK